MFYRSILVSLDFDAPSMAMVRLARSIADRFGARVIAVCAAAVPPPVVSAEGLVFDGELMEVERETVEKRLDQLEAEFRSEVGPTLEVQWRSAVSYPSQFLIDSARAADLVIASSSKGVYYSSPDPGMVVLGAGRPVLFAARNVDQPPAQKILVAWKDSREARRAVADALPFLKSASQVVVATVEPDPDQYVRDGLQDVASFLQHHGAATRTEILTEHGDAEQLVEFAMSEHADLIVSGAYGHSRVREWAFGGVTRSLLDEDSFHRLMSY